MHNLIFVFLHYANEIGSSEGEFEMNCFLENPRQIPFKFSFHILVKKSDICLNNFHLWMLAFVVAVELLTYSTCESKNADWSFPTSL